MDFARKQLEKYGWTDGKGLGKNENGISHALKPKLKRSVAGVGYDAAADFTEHWWSALYDKAAKNVEVKEKNGKTKKLKAKEDEFEITNSTWRIKKGNDTEDSSEKEYSDFFVKTAILTGGKNKTKKVKEYSEEEDNRDVFKLTDEELFAACEGRTAHKGARHGLKALGKLARIEQQEKMLLAHSKYQGYSHAKNTKGNENESRVFEDTNLDSDSESMVVSKRKKKKKKRCNSFNNSTVEDVTNASSKQEEVNVDNVKYGKIASEKRKKEKHNEKGYLDMADSIENGVNKVDKQTEGATTVISDAIQVKESVSMFKKDKKRRLEKCTDVNDTRDNVADVARPNVAIVKKRKK